MKLKEVTALGIAAVLLAGCAKPHAAAPPWVADNFPLLKRLGIDPTADLIDTGNYHWSWRSRREVIAGGFICPVGSSVDISRSIIVMRAPASQVCRGRGGDTEQMLKVFTNGSTEPFAAADESTGSASVEIPCPTPKPGYVCHITQFKPEGGVR